MLNPPQRTTDVAVLCGEWWQWLFDVGQWLLDDRYVENPNEMVQNRLLKLYELDRQYEKRHVCYLDEIKPSKHDCSSPNAFSSEI